MRKLILFAFCLLAGFASFAQNFDEVEEKMKKAKWAEAKDKLEKFSKDPKALASSDYWFIRARINRELAKTVKDSSLMIAAQESMHKYFELEGKQKDESKRMLKSLLESHQTAFDIYKYYFDAGVERFQAEDWRNAHLNFVSALEAFNDLSKYKIVNVAFDTTTTIYAGYAAQNGKMLDNAAKYYTMVADKRIADTIYVGVYEYLVSYYQNKKDAANTAKYLALGKELFPKHKMWTQFELADLDADKSKKLAKLEELSKTEPNNYDIWMEYAYELFNYVYGKDKPADYTAKQELLTNTIQHLITLKESPYTYYIMTQHLNNEIYDMQVDFRAIKGTKPEDVKKKAQINKDIEGRYELLNKNAAAASALYAAMGELKPVDTANYKWVLQQQADYYRMKKNAAKAKEFDDKAKALK